MVSKHSAVRSIRLQKEMWAWLAAEAARRETNVNGLVSDLLEVGRLRAEEARAAPVVKPQPVLAAPVHVAVPVMERKPFNPQPKAGKKK